MHTPSLLGIRAGIMPARQCGRDMSLKEMLRPGFEPESSARKAEMIGRTTLPEQQLVPGRKCDRLSPMIGPDISTFPLAFMWMDMFVEGYAP